MACTHNTLRGSKATDDFLCALRREHLQHVACEAGCNCGLDRHRQLVVLRPAAAARAPGKVPPQQRPQLLLTFLLLLLLLLLLSLAVWRGSAAVSKERRARLRLSGRRRRCGCRRCAVSGPGRELVRRQWFTWSARPRVR